MYRLILVKTALNPTGKDFMMITDHHGDKWDAIAGSVAFDATDEQAERLRQALTNFIREHVPTF